MKEQLVVTGVQARKAEFRPGQVSWGEYQREAHAKMRVYVNVNGELEYDRYVYTDQKGPEVNRARRSTLEAIRGAVTQALRLMGVEHEGVRFSQKAGCSCGCSPGWIVEAPAGHGRSVWVDAKVAWRPE